MQTRDAIRANIEKMRKAASNCWYDWKIALDEADEDQLAGMLAQSESIVSKYNV